MPALFAIPFIAAIIAAIPSVTVVTNPPRLDFQPRAYAAFSGEVAAQQPPPVELTLQERAEAIAIEYGIATTTLFNLIESESKWNPNATSTTGDFGLVQINLKATNAERERLQLEPITETQALDPDFAMRYAAQAIKDGTEWRWTVCNCAFFARALVTGFPVMDDLILNSPAKVGAVAYFKYKNSEHVAVVTSIEKEGFWVREANYKPCLIGKRFISWYDPYVVGFYSPPVTTK